MTLPDTRGHVESVILAEIVDESTAGVQKDVEPVAPHTAVLQELPPFCNIAPVDGRRLSRRVFFCQLVGAIVGGLVGSSIGDLVGGLAGTIAVLFYIGFGWRCGRGYAWMLAYSLGWTKVLPVKEAGKLFKVEKQKLHAAAALIGGFIGIATGGLWRGVLLGLTLLALADCFRAK